VSSFGFMPVIISAVTGSMYTAIPQLEGVLTDIQVTSHLRTCRTKTLISSPSFISRALTAAPRLSGLSSVNRRQAQRYFSSRITADVSLEGLSTLLRLLVCMVTWAKPTTLRRRVCVHTDIAIRISITDLQWVSSLSQEHLLEREPSTTSSPTSLFRCVLLYCVTESSDFRLRQVQ